MDCTTHNIAAIIILTLQVQPHTAIMGKGEGGREGGREGEGVQEIERSERLGGKGYGEIRRRHYYHFLFSLCLHKSCLTPSVRHLWSEFG